MSDCCLPNLGCLAIPVISTNVAGNPGQNGAPGAAATIAVGTVTTVNPGDPATVTNVGTSGAAIFDFEIPEGAAGAAGVDGVSRLYYNVTNYNSATIYPSWVQIHNFPLQANTLINDGDSILITLISVNLIQYITFPQLLQAQRRIRFNSTSCTLIPGLDEPCMISDTDAGGLSGQYRTIVEIIKTSSSTALCRVVSDLDNQVKVMNYQYNTYQISLTGLDFTVLNNIYTDLSQVIANQVYFKSITIDKITAA
jgi:hypothetical protein